MNSLAGSRKTTRFISLPPIRFLTVPVVKPSEIVVVLLCAPAWADYHKVRDAAEAEYQEVRDDTFWRLFANPENRHEYWK